MFQRSHLGVAAAAATIASTAAGPWAADTLLITGGRVLAAEGDRWLEGHVVVDRRAIPAQETRAELRAVCQRVFEALAEDRIDDLRELFLPEAVVTFQLRATDQQISIGVEQFLERARGRYGPDTSFREWISGEPTVLVDGAVAVVWAPFLVERARLRATGVDVFGFLKFDGHWRISSLSFTNRPVGST